MTINDLIKYFAEAEYSNAKYIGVKVNMIDLKECEVIINPRENFRKKMLYYIKNYDSDLRLKNAPDKVKIVRCAYGNSFSEIEDRLTPLK